MFRVKALGIKFPGAFIFFGVLRMKANCEKCRWLERDSTGLTWCDAHECYLPPDGPINIQCKDFKGKNERGVLNKRETK